MRADVKALIKRLTAERDAIDRTVKALVGENSNGAALKKRKRHKWSPEARARASERAKTRLAKAAPEAAPEIVQ